jgi:hypothetical protein
MYCILDASEKLITSFDFENSAISFVIKANSGRGKDYNICLRGYRFPFRVLAV